MSPLYLIWRSFNFICLIRKKQKVHAQTQNALWRAINGKRPPYRMQVVEFTWCQASMAAIARFSWFLRTIFWIDERNLPLFREITKQFNIQNSQSSFHFIIHLLSENFEFRSSGVFSDPTMQQHAWRSHFIDASVLGVLSRIVFWMQCYSIVSQLSCGHHRGPSDNACCLRFLEAVFVNIFFPGPTDQTT